MRALLLAVFFTVVSLFATQALAFVPPRPQGHLTDTTGMLSASERARVDAHLREIQERTGNHVIAYLVRSLEGETIEDVAYDTFQSWKIGEAGLDNGVLLVIAPTERRLRIEVGRGLEGELTDLEAGEIIREHIKPHLPQGHWAAAILEGADAIASRLESRAVLRPSPANERGAYSVFRWMGKALAWGAAATLLWFLLGSLLRKIGRAIAAMPAGGGGSSWSSSSSSSWSSGSSSSYDYGSSSSSYDSGSSSSGYDGGGGSSGGGGASDSW